MCTICIYCNFYNNDAQLQYHIITISMRKDLNKGFENVKLNYSVNWHLRFCKHGKMTLCSMGENENSILWIILKKIL